MVIFFILTLLNFYLCMGRNGDNSDTQFKFYSKLSVVYKIWSSVNKTEIYVETSSSKSLFLLPSTVVTSARQTLFPISIQILFLR